MARGEGAFVLNSQYPGRKRSVFERSRVVTARRVEHDDGRRRVAHDVPRRFEAVHAWHVRVQRDDVWRKPCHRTHRSGAAGGPADHLECGVLPE